MTTNFPTASTPAPSIHTNTAESPGDQQAAQQGFDSVLQAITQLPFQIIEIILNAIIGALESIPFIGPILSVVLTPLSNLFNNLFQTLGIEPSGLTTDPSNFQPGSVLTPGSPINQAQTANVTAAAAQKNVQSLLTGLLNGTVSVNAAGLTGQLDEGLFGTVPANSISTTNPNLLIAPDFKAANTVVAGGLWAYDSSDGHTKNGCMKFTCAGANAALDSNPVMVSAGQGYALSVYVKWSGLVADVSPMTIGVAEYSLGVLVNNTVVAGISDPGDSGGWSLMAGTYEVPANVDTIRMQFQVNQAATAGTILWDDASLVQTATQMSAGAVQGVGGMSSIAASLQNTWDSLVSALTGTNTSGASLADVAAEMQNMVGIVGQAMTVTSENANTLQIQSNQPGFVGLIDTVEGVFPVSQITGSNPTSVAVTASTSAMGFITCQKVSTKGFVTWFGKGSANISELYVNIYTMDTNGNLTLSSTSPDLSADLTTGWSWQEYVMPGPDEIKVSPGQVLAIEIQVIGSGTHNVAGIDMSWNSGVKTYPTALGATRSGVIPVGSVTYDATGGSFTQNTLQLNAAGSWSHTVAAGAALVVWILTTVNNEAQNGYTVTATCGGVAMQSLGVVSANNSTYGWVQAFGITNLSAGAKTVAISITDNGSAANLEVVYATSVSYKNVGSFGSIVTNAAQGTGLSSGTISSAASQMVAQAFVYGDIGGTSSLSGYNHTVRANPNINSATSGDSSSLAPVVGDVAGAASVSFSATGSNNDFWGSLAIPLIPPFSPAPATIAAANVSYSGNVPWIGIGVSNEPPDYEPPITKRYFTSGSYIVSLPNTTWAYLDLILLGAGGGGQPAAGFFGATDQGGSGGDWTTVTLQAGIDIAADATSVTLTVGAGGTHGAAQGGNGNPGGATTVTYTDINGIQQTVTANGGLGGGTNGNTTSNGLSPGNTVYNGATYQGGSDVVYNQDGSPPGGGGGGAGPAALGNNGADGAAWIIARQT